MVAGWTLDRKIRVRFPAYPHRVWALWWQGGKRLLRTSLCPCRGRLGTLKTPSCPWRGCPAAGQNLETGHLSLHYKAEISLNVTLNHKTTTTTIKWYMYHPLQVVSYDVKGHYNAHFDSSEKDKSVPCCTRDRTRQCRICRCVTLAVVGLYQWCH